MGSCESPSNLINLPLVGVTVYTQLFPSLLEQGHVSCCLIQLSDKSILTKEGKHSRNIAQIHEQIMEDDDDDSDAE